MYLLYREQHVRLYKTVKFLQFNFNHFPIKRILKYSMNIRQLRQIFHAIAHDCVIKSTKHTYILLFTHVLPK
jgi:hypothetical protein